ncbi:hypothetical protein M408DRAFT_147218 [Serendipita vermifera MAFF 305830]|uniref:Uncharacterized protein n=1 Tax=Serendipita vermifera MAFF 305830 TaxID=933852 RepID=A0A0C3B978_SERVB|nr:hypothetical protein M408DRAFT_147218 [Serendipita vermifera MAFF 305830]
MRPIRRLQIDKVDPYYHPQLLESLKSSPGRLTHLIFSDNLDDFELYTAIIKEAPDLFVQLQHLGGIPWLSHPIAVTFVDSTLSVLKLLPNLTSLSVYTSAYKEKRTRDALIYLSKLHHKLRKVWLYTPDPRCLLWERHDGAWERREVSSSSSWDITRGILD